MKYEEHEMQCAVVDWFRYQYPKKTIYAIPNGGKRNVREAARLKKEGVLAGVSDLFVMVASGEHHGLYLELKAKGKKATESQKDFLEKASKENYKTAVCDTFESAVREIRCYLDVELNISRRGLT